MVFMLFMFWGGFWGVCWIDLENYYIILWFIGDIDDWIVDEVVDVFDRVCCDLVEICLDGFGVFGNGKFYCVWFGVCLMLELVEL